MKPAAKKEAEIIKQQPAIVTAAPSYLDDYGAPGTPLPGIQEKSALARWLKYLGSRVAQALTPQLDESNAITYPATKEGRLL